MPTAPIPAVTRELSGDREHFLINLVFTPKDVIKEPSFPKEFFDQEAINAFLADMLLSEQNKGLQFYLYDSYIDLQNYSDLVKSSKENALYQYCKKIEDHFEADVLSVPVSPFCNVYTIPASHRHPTLFDGNNGQHPAIFPVYITGSSESIYQWMTGVSAKYSFGDVSQNLAGTFQSNQQSTLSQLLLHSYLAQFVMLPSEPIKFRDSLFAQMRKSMNPMKRKLFDFHTRKAVQ